MGFIPLNIVIFRLPSGVIKHRLLESGPQKKVMFLYQHFHSVRGFSSLPCLISRGYPEIRKFGEDPVAIKLQEHSTLVIFQSHLSPPESSVVFVESGVRA